MMYWQSFQVEESLKEQQGLVTSLEQQLDAAKQQYQQESSHSDDLRSQLRDKQAQMEEQSRTLSDRWAKICMLN